MPNIRLPQEPSSTCIITGADGENPDDCTTHQHKRHGSCTCCVEPRAVTFVDDAGEWAHDDDETEASMFHIHHSSHSSDCDGPHEQYHTARRHDLRWDEGDQVDDWHFWRREAQSALPYHAACTVEISEQGDRCLTMDFGYATDEGGVSGELRGCRDAYCAFEGATQRDVFAERMNY